MVMEMQFHRLGHAMLNDLFVNVILLVKGTQRSEDCRPSLEIVDLSSSNSDKYDGA